MRKNQRGFSGIEGLLILLIVCIVGFIGWYVCQNKNAKSDSTTQNQTTQSSETPGSTINNPEVYKTKEECEKISSKTCMNQSCDNVPEGKTLEELCGKNFKKGWVTSN